MTINANIYVLFILLLMIVVGVVAWRLARRKSRHPVLVTVLCVLLCLVPPFALWRCSFWRSGEICPSGPEASGVIPATADREKPLSGLYRVCGR